MLFNPSSPKPSRFSNSPNKSPSVSPKTTPVRTSASPQGQKMLPFGAVARSSTSETSREDGRALLEALGELEFRRQFLILSYSDGKDLQSVILAEEIRALKHVRMTEFERQVWEKIGRYCIDRKDRQQKHDWDFGKTHIYHCYVSLEGCHKFKGPYLSRTSHHLQKVLGDDNVLMVKFAEKETKCLDIGDDGYSYYRKLAKEGILVGLRRYRFFVFKDGGKEEKKKDPNSSPVKCYFVRFESEALIDQNTPYILSNKTVFEARCLFMHAHTVSSVPSYMARFSLILSKTFTFGVDLSLVNIQRVEDQYCLDESGDRVYRDGKPLIHTDGTGYISEDLALFCPKNLFKGDCLRNKIIEPSPPCPLLMQFRLFNNGLAVKGTFLVNKKLQPKTMVIRDSMVKVEADPMLLNNQAANSLEIVGTSIAPKKTYLSKNLILLLSYGGVPDDFFLSKVEDALDIAYGAYTDKSSAFKVSISYGGIDDDSTLARMIACGIPLEEPYLQCCLSILMKEEKKALRGGRILVPDSYYLMGTADPTGKLEKDEVCVILDSGQVSGKVLVYRNPGLHFGDVHVLKATYVVELESFVGNAKYAIFFPCKGPRSIADEIGTGDFDGDLYWVSRNPQLLEHFQPSEPWSPNPSTYKVPTKKPDEFDAEQLDIELFNLFLRTRFQPSFAISEAADCWIALMDRYLTLRNISTAEKDTVRENIIRLINIYYDALDAPKKGGPKIEVPKDLKVDRFPHYMEKNSSYKSCSILGAIYDLVGSYQTEDQSNNIKEIWKLRCFDVEVPEASLVKWKDYYAQYLKDMCNAMNAEDKDAKSLAADEVIIQYKKLLYGPAGTLKGRTRNLEEIYNDALAIYIVNYEYAMSKNNAGLCGFAWKVAGPALFNLYISSNPAETETEPFMFLPSILREMFR
ncbi:hypothetical protein UlMin_022170 [Ulmus minor]